MGMIPGVIWGVISLGLGHGMPCPYGSWEGGAIELGRGRFGWLHPGFYFSNG